MSPVTPSGETVVVEAAARLHLGVLDLRGSRGRWFGGIGAAAPGPSVLVSAAPSPVLEVTGCDPGRAEAFAARFLASAGLSGGGRVHVHRAIPPHVGLGSGTQLALAVARALAELHGLTLTPAVLAAAVGRGQRSAIGIWTFADGGLVVEGGRRTAEPGCGPRLARLPFPADWRAIVAVPDGVQGLSGADETAAFAHLAPPPAGEAEAMAHAVLMGLLPALADADLAAFGEALDEIQARTARWFAAAQGGGLFASDAGGTVARTLRALGVRGVGQSSWGPAVYGFVGDEAAEAAVVARLRAAHGDRVRVHAGPPRATGAHVRRDRVSAEPAGARLPPARS